MKKEDKFLNIFPVKSHRLAGFDYGSNGSYFVTIKTRQMRPYLGSIVQTCNSTSLKKAAEHNKETCFGTSRQLTEIGLIAEKNWLAIPSHFPFVRLDNFEIMPNHIHGILVIEKSGKKTWCANEFKSQSETLGMIINRFKGSVTRYANTNKIEFKWHPRYHDSIIRDHDSLQNIRNYILKNPQKMA